MNNETIEKTTKAKAAKIRKALACNTAVVEAYQNALAVGASLGLRLAGDFSYSLNYILKSTKFKGVQSIRLSIEDYLGKDEYSKAYNVFRNIARAAAVQYLTGEGFAKVCTDSRNGTDVYQMKNA